MHLDRRSLLRAVAGAVAASVVPFRTIGSAKAATTSTTTGSGLASLTMASFQRYVNTSFRLQVAGRSIVMPLTKVTDDRASSATSKGATGGECFSLIFAGSQPAFPQATYSVDHASLGRFNLFIVPVGRRTNGQDYQAVFNRIAA